MIRYRYYYKIRRNAQLLLLLLLFCQNAKSTAGDIYVRAEATREQENTYIVTLYQGVFNTPAASLVLFLLMDSDLGAFMPINLSESAPECYTQIAAVQKEAGFVISEVLHVGMDKSQNLSCLAIAIYNKNGAGGLKAGALFSCNLQPVSESVPVKLHAATIETPVLLNGTPCVSSAATPGEHPLAIFFEPTIINQQCNALEPPKQVKASRCHNNKIVVTWAPPKENMHFEYKVYRSATDDVATAVPLDLNYSSGLSWTDEFDEQAHSQPGGCTCSRQFFHYWVRAKDVETGCISDFSAPSARGAFFSP